jgi:ubiquinone/menaquinone biosynthesis C-methylase UbiE
MEQIKKAVQSQFGKAAEAYVTSEGHAKGKDLAKLVEVSEASPEDRMLDIATGGGHVANALAPLVNHVTALDLTKEILDAAERFIRGNGHTNVSFVQGDAEELPFEPGSYDLVTCRIAPHHFPNVSRFVSEVSRVLKPGGRFLLVDNVAPEDEQTDQYYNEIEKRRDYSHHRALKKTEWIRLLEEAGMQLIELHSYNKRFPFDPWCERMQLPLEEKESLNQFMVNAPQKVKEKLRIQISDGKVITFEGESILIKAKKRTSP